MEKIKQCGISFLQKGLNGLQGSTRIFAFVALFFITTFLALSCPDAIAQSTVKPKKSAARKTYLYGQASYYSQKFEGRKTSSGEILRHAKFTAACNALPLGTTVKVTNLKNGKSVIVRINDRLHVKTKRLLDLTTAGAKKLGYISAGLTRVKIEVLPKKT